MPGKLDVHDTRVHPGRISQPAEYFRQQFFVCRVLSRPRENPTAARTEMTKSVWLSCL